MNRINYCKTHSSLFPPFPSISCTRLCTYVSVTYVVVKVYCTAIHTHTHHLVKTLDSGIYNPHSFTTLNITSNGHTTERHKLVMKLLQYKRYPPHYTTAPQSLPTSHRSVRCIHTTTTHNMNYFKYRCTYSLSSPRFPRETKMESKPLQTIRLSIQLQLLLAR